LYLRILNDEEIGALYGRPVFSPEERTKYFVLSPEEKATLEQLHSVKSQIFLIMQLGYFKSRRQFFSINLNEARKDIRFIQAFYFPEHPIVDSPITKATRLKHQQLILSLFDYRYCQIEERQALYRKARQLAKFSSRPINICRELINFLQQQHIVLPGYRFLQETISQVLMDEQKRLTDILRQHLATTDIKVLQQLLDDTPGLYEITQLKQEPRNFKEGEIKRELRRGEQLQPLYRLAQALIPQLGISREIVKYYASLVGYYSVYKLNRMDSWQVNCQIWVTSVWSLHQTIVSDWKPCGKLMTGSAMVLPANLLSKITKSVPVCIPVVMGKNLKPKPTPSMLVIHPNILV